LGDGPAERRWVGLSRGGVEEVGEAGCLVEARDPERGQPEEVQDGAADADVGVPAAVDPAVDAAAARRALDSRDHCTEKRQRRCWSGPTEGVLRVCELPREQLLAIVHALLWTGLQGLANPPDNLPPSA